ncbi:dCTP deaminase, dUMP-forming [Candidatus Gugararchaeum adminiculabundum]|nr:dCTP deaminase, dUMP-forming [Candidatus Gugararchaeum adminiculabundum]
MNLSDNDIRTAIKAGKLKIEPRLSEEQLGAASIDLTLAGEFWKFKKQLRGKTVDLKKTDFKQATYKINAKTLELKPGEMALGITREKITVANDLMGKLEGRSRYARMGLAVHVTSALVQPGSSNRQVLEIVNLSPFTIVIHEGMRISQVVFETLASKTSKPYAKFGKIARKQ